MSQPRDLYNRLALALLLPLYMQTTNMYELAIVILTTMVITLGVFCFSSKPFNFNLACQIAIALSGTFLSSTTVNHTIHEPQARLLTTYFLSLPALWDLFPETKPKQQEHCQKFMRRCLSADECCCSVFLYITTFAGVLTFASVKCGLFNLNAEWYWVLVGCLAVYATLMYPLLLAAIACVRSMEVKAGKSKVAADGLDSVTAEQDNKVKDIKTYTRVNSATSQVAGEDGIDVPISQTQKRPSTRRRD